MRRAWTVCCFVLFALVHAISLAAPPQEAELHKRLAAGHAKAGNLQDALKEWQSAYEIRPEPLVLFEIARVYDQLGDKNRAVETYLKVAEMEVRGRRAAVARERVASLQVAIRSEEASAAARDDDGDGVPNGDDACPREAEDRDGFSDADGCPDPDNDRDDIADVVDKCPDKAEDKDEIDDSDGCPDDDDDHDGLAAAVDRCPEQAEDRDGHDDLDGCPDPDDDGDGVLDVNDKCLELFEDTDGFEDSDGCPEPDNDKDGLLDRQDRCPNEAGRFVGCPPKKQWVRGIKPLRYVAGALIASGLAAGAAAAYYGVQMNSADEGTVEYDDNRNKMFRWGAVGAGAMGAGIVMYLVGQYVGGHYEEVAPTFSAAPTASGGVQIWLVGRF